MPSPFPGMDPYLEHPDRWPDVHTRLIVELGNRLSDRLAPRYVVAVEQRTYMMQPDELVFLGRPDVALIDSGSPGNLRPATLPFATPVVGTLPVPEEVRERYLEVRGVDTGEVVTVLELLSPTNKRPGKGRRLYERKRAEVLGSQTNLVEVDLLRAGRSMPALPLRESGRYRILLARGARRPRVDLYDFGIRDAIPVFPLPLRPGEAEPEVEVQAALEATYRNARYDLRIAYDRPPEPDLAPEDAVWARSRVGEGGGSSERR